MKSQVPSRKSKVQLRQAGRLPERPGRVVDEVWWGAVNPNGVVIWPYLQLKKRDVEECLDDCEEDWRSEGWRVVKLRVVELTTKG